MREKEPLVWGVPVFRSLPWRGPCLPPGTESPRRGQRNCYNIRPRLPTSCRLLVEVVYRIVKGSVVHGYSLCSELDALCLRKSGARRDSAGPMDSKACNYNGLGDEEVVGGVVVVEAEVPSNLDRRMEKGAECVKVLWRRQTHIQLFS